MFLWRNLALLWAPPRIPPSLAHEGISEKKGVGFADFGRHMIAPDGKYIIFFILLGGRPVNHLIGLYCFLVHPLASF